MCGGRDHRLLAGASEPLALALTGASHWQALAGILPAIAFSAGWTSPDCDNTWLMKKATKWIPGKWDSEIFGHRRLMHWWGLPALAAHFANRSDLGGVGWLVWAALIGWTSHILGDFFFGQEGYGTPKGVPLLLWFWHVGVGMKSDGDAERALIWPICLSLWWWTLGHPGSQHIIQWASAR